MKVFLWIAMAIFLAVASIQSSLCQWELDHVKEFTKYQRIDNLIETCEGTTSAKDEILWYYDRNYRDSIYKKLGL